MKYTEDEKKVIEQFRYMIADFRETKNEIMVTEEGINTLETLLNLLEKQQKEIETVEQKSYIKGFGDSEKKYNTVLADNIKLKTENELYKHRLEVANEFIESRIDGLISEIYEDLKYIINECDLESTW